MAPWFDLVIPSAAEMYFSEHPASACGRKVKDRSRMDIVEHNDSYVVTIDAPGLAQDDIKVELKEGTLRITGEKSTEDKENAHGNVIYSEKRKQSFFRSFPLPSDADDANIIATHTNGVLNVTIKKKEPEKPRVVNIPVITGQQHVAIDPENQKDGNTAIDNYDLCA